MLQLCGRGGGGITCKKSCGVALGKEAATTAAARGEGSASASAAASEKEESLARLRAVLYKRADVRERERERV
jgi:hypothetical protein